MPETTTRKFAVITGGSTGIGLELARQFANNDYDILIAADTNVAEAEAQLRSGNAAEVTAFNVDLSSEQGVRALYDKIISMDRPVDALAANAGLGHGHSFFDQDRADWIKIVDTNVIGTLDLVYLVGRDMRSAGRGRILITSSIASQMPGAFQAVYNASKAFLQSFSFAIRNELKDSGVSVTALLPGATDTAFFERADMLDTKVGQAEKDDPADVARVGYDALMAGDGDVVYGMKNKMQVAATKVLSDDRLAEMHRGMSGPGTAK
jgi:short-subunit dehydrogenase